MEINIYDFTVKSIFSELKIVDNTSFNELYQEYIKETNKVGGKSITRNGKEIISLFLNKEIDSGIEMKCYDKDVNAIQIPPMDGGDIPEGETFEEYRQFVIDSLSGKIDNPYDENPKESYSQLFVDTIAPLRGKDFMAEIQATQSIDELNNLFDSTLIELDNVKITAIYDKLVEEEPKRKEDFLSKHGVQMPSPNIFKYLKDIESKKGLYADLRKHRHLDLKGMRDSMSKYTAGITMVGVNEGMINGKNSEYTDISSQGKEIYNRFLKTPLSDFYDFYKEYDLSAYQRTYNRTLNLNYDSILDLIDKALPIGTNDELRNSLIEEGNELVNRDGGITYAEFTEYQTRTVKTLQPYLIQQQGKG